MPGGGVVESDSDEDCYGNNAIKLQNLKNNYRAEKPSAPVKVIREDSGSPINVLPASTLNTANTSADDSIINLLEEVPTVPDMPPVVLSPKIVTGISETPKKRVTRSAARSSQAQTDPVSTGAGKPSRRGQKRKTVAPPPASASLPVPEAVALMPVVAPTVPAVVPTVPAVAPIPPAAAPPPPQASPPSGRGTRGARGNQRVRAPSRGRGRRSIQRSYYDQLLLNSVIYSVGNTDEYPDELESVPLFNRKADAEVSVVEDADLSSSFSEDNEEISVKVYWQQSEYVKFNIRRFQKLSQIFEFFSKRESVSSDKLLFTLKGQILRPDDTPDSIDYNIALFIDGGIVNSSIAGISAVSSNKENKTLASGIMLKFQCQNFKKPFETSIQLDQKLSVAMIKCAEHFELPYQKLRFMLDGESVSAGSTAVELGLDNGDCIDVNTIA